MNILHRIEKGVDALMARVPRAYPKAHDIENCRIIAHRGAHDVALGVQENTMEAFERALQLGCDGIEFDVHATKDGVLVINHDPDLTRLWGHDVAINHLNFVELRTLAPALPSLTEVITRYAKCMHLFIELKVPFTEVKTLADVLQGLTPAVDYHLLCLDEAFFPQLTPFPQSSWLVVPVHNNVRQLCKLSLSQSYGGVLGHYLLLKNRQVKQLKAATQFVGVGFVDSKWSLYRELNRGIHLLFTNKAGIVMQSLKVLREE